MRRTRNALTRVALVATLLTAFTALAPSPAHAVTTTPRARMYQATNNSRLNNGVRRVDLHYTISRLARQHSIAMANRGSIFHTSKSKILGTYLKGVKWSTWGENVGVTGGTISGMQSAFMQLTRSPFEHPEPWIPPGGGRHLPRRQRPPLGHGLLLRLSRSIAPAALDLGTSAPVRAPASPRA